jgi:hypothetical protein
MYEHAPDRGVTAARLAQSLAARRRREHRRLSSRVPPPAEVSSLYFPPRPREVTARLHGRNFCIVYRYATCVQNEVAYRFGRGQGRVFVVRTGLSAEQIGRVPAHLAEAHRARRAYMRALEDWLAAHPEVK